MAIKHIPAKLLTAAGTILSMILYVLLAGKVLKFYSTRYCFQSGNLTNVIVGPLKQTKPLIRFAQKQGAFSLISPPGNRYRTAYTG